MTAKEIMQSPWWARSVELVVTTACCVVLLLVTASNPSADDVGKGLGSGLLGFLVSRFFGGKQA